MAIKKIRSTALSTPKLKKKGIEKQFEANSQDLDHVQSTSSFLAATPPQVEEALEELREAFQNPYTGSWPISSPGLRGRSCFACGTFAVHFRSQCLWLAKWCKIHKVYIHSYSMLLLIFTNIFIHIQQPNLHSKNIFIHIYLYISYSRLYLLTFTRCLHSHSTSYIHSHSRSKYSVNIFCASPLRIGQKR